MSGRYDLQRGDGLTYSRRECVEMLILELKAFRELKIIGLPQRWASASVSDSNCLEEATSDFIEDEVMVVISEMKYIREVSTHVMMNKGPGSIVGESWAQFVSVAALKSNGSGKLSTRYDFGNARTVLYPDMQ